MMQDLLNAVRPLLAPAFTLWGGPVTGLEIAAFVLSLAMVLANLRVKPAGWPLGIAASLAYGLLFLDSKLYGEAALQVLFVILSCWGWWQWLRGRGANGAALQVHTLSAGQRWAALAATLAVWPLVGWALAQWTDSPAPYLDALATTGSITGQLLLGRKLLENWAVWLMVNVLSVGLFASRSLWLTSILYALFAALSWAGWRAWRQRVQAIPAPALVPAR